MTSFPVNQFLLPGANQAVQGVGAPPPGSTSGSFASATGHSLEGGGSGTNSGHGLLNGAGGGLHSAVNAWNASNGVTVVSGNHGKNNFGNHGQFTTPPASMQDFTPAQAPSMGSAVGAPWPSNEYAGTSFGGHAAMAGNAYWGNGAGGMQGGGAMQGGYRGVAIQNQWGGGNYGGGGGKGGGNHHKNHHRWNHNQAEANNSGQYHSTGSNGPSPGWGTNNQYGGPNNGVCQSSPGYSRGNDRNEQRFQQPGNSYALQQGAAPYGSPGAAVAAPYGSPGAAVAAPYGSPGAAVAAPYGSPGAAVAAPYGSPSVVPQNGVVQQSPYGAAAVLPAASVSGSPNANFATVCPTPSLLPSANQLGALPSLNDAPTTLYNIDSPAHQLPHAGVFARVGPIQSRALGGPMSLLQFLQDKWLTIDLQTRVRWLTISDTRVIDRLYHLMRKVGGNLERLYGGYVGHPVFRILLR